VTYLRRAEYSRGHGPHPQTGTAGTPQLVTVRLTTKLDQLPGQWEPDLAAVAHGTVMVVVSLSVWPRLSATVSFTV
jgi:hypothetical protein